MKNQVTYLSTDRLSIGYVQQQKERSLFENLDLELMAGQLVCFMGPNGIGKSSLIRTLAGLQKPLSGQLQIKHTNKDASRAQQISVVLTDKISSSAMTAYEVIAFGRYPYLDWSIRLSKKDEQIIANAIEMVHIEHLMNQKLYELSDGQLQMVMIARALVQDTPIILLDEPTAHLDLNNRVEVMKLLKRLSRTTSKAILVATHELDLALQLADWIWLTGKNKEILTGMPEELVLDGSFDAIFQFKGFDLKTGKIQHEAHKGIAVTLMGEDYEFRWTKNALERNGFLVSNQHEAISISVIREKDQVQWQLRQSGDEKVFNSLSQLINSI